MSDTVSNKITNLLSSSSKGILFNILKIIIAAGLLAYLILKVNFQEIIVALKNANVALIYITAILAFLNIFLQYQKWRITCGYLLKEKNKKKILLSLFYGFSGGVFTPARIGEYFGRAVAFRDKSLLQVTIATFIDKLFPLMVVVSFGSLASILFLHYYYHVSVYLTGSLFILLVILFYLAYDFLMDPGFWNNMLFTRLSKHHKLKKFLDNIVILKKLDRIYSTKMVFISVSFYTCYIFQFALLAAAFTRHIDYIHYIWAGNLIIFSKSIIPPVSLGELGIREGASVFFLQQFGETAVAGFNASIFLFLINVLIPSIIGLLLLFRKNDN
jgi:uncharacterized membrane protein YbhN (UPF0104 family)